MTRRCALCGLRLASAALACGFSRYSFDSAFLYVHFGPDGRVVSAEITGG
jgi:hypothetical protein